MQNVPLYISVAFVLTTLLTVFIFWYAAKKSPLVLIVLAAWLLLQSIMAVSGFYTVSNTNPPRFALLVIPPLVFIVILFLTRKGKNFIDGLSLRSMTVLHIVRIPVEFVLFILSVYKAVPELMTFEGRNFDILSGLSAPVIFYMAFIKKQLNNRILILWNIVCLLLLLNVVINAVFSAPFPFQAFAFEQPNIAILYFPFVWLPCCVVPIILFAHLASIRQLVKH